MSALTLDQSRVALARANARVQAQRPNDLALALMVQRRYARRVAFLEGREDQGSCIAHTVGQGHESTLDNELVKPTRGPAEPYVVEQAA